MAADSPLSSWTPPLDNSVTLRAAYERMPGYEADAIPRYVRLLENPASPIALAGAVDLFGHDCIHILLGRGMRPRDEAFVIGVTMGASGELRSWQYHAYLFCSRYLFRGPYRFGPFERTIFQLGVRFAQATGIRPLHCVGWRQQLDRTLGDLRSDLRIDLRNLTTVWEMEQLMADSAALPFAT
ncbi:hypothetical protein ThrDRAFT_04269 [Frankia casuarinae]|uniref:Uncharacterized protein n=2 Tax=Frankia TaxID=1854 RepID=Q2J9J1_FRACC|nr:MULTISPECIES: hypothetical protein [Frankia]OHV53709.1 hypothetical protein CgIS1_13880 [Frankia sp. CgIS1]ABD12051.1 hypothetical protein Francci3_2690 [Frankia casuarinae]ETA01986.1 hypothetical protein CcI6DRAFT_02509 [Frankia sp. CcI6]EYT90099.1 hypothetical protein ThrDRAFT_04269 [Frankia casuarinae]KFB02569.1 hypothetical protein ALLO2DRAFT_04683 [Frankia sp. Allo2]